VVAAPHGPHRVRPLNGTAAPSNGCPHHLQRSAEIGRDSTRDPLPRPPRVGLVGIAEGYEQMR